MKPFIVRLLSFNHSFIALSSQKFSSMPFGRAGLAAAPVNGMPQNSLSGKRLKDGLHENINNFSAGHKSGPKNAAQNSIACN
jgi:hypothetical protein